MLGETSCWEKPGAVWSARHAAARVTSSRAVLHLFFYGPIQRAAMDGFAENILSTRARREPERTKP